MEEEGLGSAHENLVHEYENRAFSSNHTRSHKKRGFHKLRNSISPIKENTCHYALFFIFAWDVLFFIYLNALCRGDHPPPNGGLPLCKCFLLLSKDRTLSEVFTIQLLGRGAAVTNRCSVMDNCDKVPGNSYFGWVQWAHRISLTIKLLRRVTIVAKMVCNIV